MKKKFILLLCELNDTNGERLINSGHWRRKDVSERLWESLSDMRLLLDCSDTTQTTDSSAANGLKLRQQELKYVALDGILSHSMSDTTRRRKIYFVGFGLNQMLVCLRAVGVAQH